MIPSSVRPLPQGGFDQSLQEEVEITEDGARGNIIILGHGIYPPQRISLDLSFVRTIFYFSCVLGFF